MKIWVLIELSVLAKVVAYQSYQSDQDRDNAIFSSIADFQIQQTINSISLVYVKTKTNPISGYFWWFPMLEMKGRILIW